MVVLHAARVAVRQLVAREDVPPSQLDGVDVHLPGGDVEQHLAGDRLELPRPSVRSAPARVREDRRGRPRPNGDAVWPGEQHAHRGRRPHGPRRRVGADVLHVVDLGGEDRAVDIERHPRHAVLVAGLARRHEVLPPVFDPLDCRRYLARRQHEAHVLAVRDDLLPEPAARVAHDHPDGVFGDAEQTRAESPHLVGGLRRRPDGELARRPLDDHSPRLHRHGGVRLLVEGLGHHVGRGGACLVHRVGLGAAQLTRDVVGVGLVHQLGRLLGVDVVDDGRERFVVDVDEVDGVLGDVPALGHDQRDRVADEAGLALRQRRPRRIGHVLPHEPVPLLAHVGVEVGGDEHRVDTRVGPRG